ncbi:MAG: sulfur oxidation c-type cytochrome SoxA [Limibacillus sp.]|jgi:L-cysteine S-thiosulfotransferase
MIKNVSSKLSFAASLLALGLIAGTAAAQELVRSDVTIPYREGNYVSIKPAHPENPLSEVISGNEFRTAETREQNADEFQNPGYLLVEEGARLWEMADGTETKACADCHGDAADSMSGVGASYPKWDEKAGQPLALQQRINSCRENNMGAEAWDWESGDMLSMVSFVKNQSLGQPMKLDFSQGDMETWRKKGEELYYTRVGQLDMACSNCHEDNYGNFIRADMLSQGQINGFPTYRFKWQGVGSLHRRFVGCMRNIRAEPYKRGSDEYVALEVYLSWRGEGLPLESPSVRN